MSTNPGGDNRDLINRLNRAQGQIEAIKKILEGGSNSDCLKTMQLLKAANNALKKFGEAYVERHLTDCIHRGVPERELESNLKEVISSAFSL
ncbi:MAG: metal-sensitive transcriptional regulator [bacterium]|nr:metal-sensitive transcriptional regulator [bacterium]